MKYQTMFCELVFELQRLKYLRNKNTDMHWSQIVKQYSNHYKACPPKTERGEFERIQYVRITSIEEIQRFLKKKDNIYYFKEDFEQLQMYIIKVEFLYMYNTAFFQMTLDKNVDFRMNDYFIRHLMLNFFFFCFWVLTVNLEIF